MYLKGTFKILCISTIAASSIHAITLKESIERVMINNPEILAEKSNQKAFRKYIDERKGNYFPRIDIDGRIEKSNSDKKYDKPNKGNFVDGSEQEDGYNFGIALNQMLYDGNLTPSRVREAKHNYASNNFRTKMNIDNIVKDTITSYIDLVKYKELLELTKNMITTNEENLDIAKEKENISGEILETYQVDSKLNFVKEKYFEEEDLKNSKISTFKRYIGVKPEGNECRPKLDFTKIPNSLQETLEIAVLKNNEILQQIEKIKAQREKIAQADAKFLPNLNLELKAITDNDLALNEEGTENQAFARINLAWNLYNGGSDYAVSKQEELFLAEQKERLNAITNKIVESVKVNYQRIQKNRKRIDILKNYVMSNENIVNVYKDEFDAGTRTFVDILDAQTVLYEAKKSLVNREYELYSNYYELLNKLSILSDTVLSSNSEGCAKSSIALMSTKENKDLKKTSKNKKANAVSNDLKALLGDESSENNSTSLSQSNKNKDVVIETKDDISKSEKMESFLNSPSKYYTLNLTTVSGLKGAKNYIKRNKLDSSQSYTYEFGPNMKSAKVIYGIFASIEEAKKAKALLPKAVKAGKPYIDNLNKHQKLYKKYH